jgi:hypothetical protein
MMPDGGREKANQTKAKTKKPKQGAKVKDGRPAEADSATKPVSAAKETSSMKKPVATGKAKSQVDRPRLVHRDGLAYVQGCDVPVWRLEMARRAGSGPDALIGASPGLTHPGLELALAYARKHRQEIDALIRVYGPIDPPPEDEDDEDEAAFEADLDALFAENAEVFRRLAE